MYNTVKNAPEKRRICMKWLQARNGRSSSSSGDAYYEVAECVRGNPADKPAGRVYWTLRARRRGLLFSVIEQQFHETNGQRYQQRTGHRVLACSAADARRTCVINFLLVMCEARINQRPDTPTGRCDMVGRPAPTLRPSDRNYCILPDGHAPRPEVIGVLLGKAVYE